MSVKTEIVVFRGGEHVLDLLPAETVWLKPGMEVITIEGPTAVALPNGPMPEHLWEDHLQALRSSGYRIEWLNRYRHPEWPDSV